MIQHLLYRLSIIMTSNVNHRLTRGAPVCLVQQLHPIGYIGDKVIDVMLGKPIGHLLSRNAEGKATKPHHRNFCPNSSAWVVFGVQVRMASLDPSQGLTPFLHLLVL